MLSTGLTFAVSCCLALKYEPQQPVHRKVLMKSSPWRSFSDRIQSLPFLDTRTYMSLYDLLEVARSMTSKRSYNKLALRPAVTRRSPARFLRVSSGPERSNRDSRSPERSNRGSHSPERSNRGSRIPERSNRGSRSPERSNRGSRGVRAVPNGVRAVPRRVKNKVRQTR